MEFHSVDIPGMEKQRYESIKKSGEYLELTVLIGVENDVDKNGTTYKNPVVATHMCGCGAQEIASLYSTLHAFLKTLKERYPLECLLGDMLMNTESLNVITLDEDDEKDNNKED